MAINFKKIWTGLTVVPKTNSTSDSKGELEVIDASGKIQYHNGTSVSPMVTEAHAAPLTNKTVVVASNTITTAASGNLAATELNAALAELQTDIDTRATSTTLTSHTGASSGVHGVTGNVVGTSDAQSLTNKNLVDASTAIVDSTDATKKIVFDAAGATATATTIVSSQTVARTITLPDATDTLVGRATTDTLTNKTLTSPVINTPTGIVKADVGLGNVDNTSDATKNAAVATLTNKSLVDASTSIVDSIDATKKIIFDAAGTTATTTTILSSQTVNRTLTLPDATDTIVGRATTDTLTNKTLTGANIQDPTRLDVKKDTKVNLTTYASTATNGQIVFATDTKEMYQIVDNALVAVGSGGGGVADVDALLTQTFDDASIVDFTQTGLSLITSGPLLHGAQTARLIHQAATSQSFKQTISVDPKFRGLGMSFQALLRSTASEGNVTLTITDETNATSITTANLQTDAVAITSLTTTNASASVTGFSNVDINSLSVGMSVTGTGIPTGTTISAINTTTNTITLSANATASGTVSLRFSALPKTLQVGFLIPANCASLSYTVTALQESGSPETYIDDVVLANYWIGASNQGQTELTVPTVEQQSSELIQNASFGGVVITGALSSSNGSGIYSYNSATGIYTMLKAAQLNIAATFGNSTPPVSPAIYKNGSTIIATHDGVNSVGYTSSTAANVRLAAGETFQINNLGGVTNTQKITVTATAVSTTTVITNDLVPAKAVLGNSTLEIPNVTEWQSYTPTFTGFGTPTGVEFQWRQNGENVEVRGKFTAGTVSATEGRITLPNGYTSAGTNKIPSIQIAGKGNSSLFATTYFSGLSVLIEPSVTYMTLGVESSTGSGLTKMQPTNLGNGISYSISASVPISGLTATTTKTISGTQQLLTSSSDSSLIVSTFAGLGSTATKVVRFSTLTSNTGSDVSYTSSSVNGDSFTIQTAGVYDITFQYDSGVANSYFGITKNASSLTTFTNSDFLNFGRSPAAANYTQEVTWSGILAVGDIIRAQTDGGTSTNTGNNRFIITKQGSTKVVNTTSDQKIEIPTSELRFEGASSRGSTATAVVKFDTLAKIRGDAFTVTNTAADGTYITMTKAGKLDVQANFYAGAVGWAAQITLNQTTLTALSSTASQIIAQENNTSGMVGALHGSIFVNVGDVIRVVANQNPSNDSSMHFHLSFQEQKIAVSVSNTLPQFSESDSCVRVDTANGYGSTATRVIRYSNIRDNIGTDIVYTDSATLGGSFTVQKSGIYDISMTCTHNAATGSPAITKNASSLTTDPALLSVSEILALDQAGSGTNNNLSWQGYLNAGDVIRAESNTATFTGVNIFTISKVGKPNVTGVNVTPFISVPQPTTQSSTINQNASFGAATITGALSSSNGSGIFSYNSSTGTYTVLRNATFAINASFTASSAVTVLPSINVNGTAVSSSSSPNTVANQWTTAAATVYLTAGTTFNVTNASANTTTTQLINVTATALSDQILTAPESFSTDTASLTYASSSQYTLSTLANAPVGTYITYAVAASGNTRTQTTDRPTQTDADMNANGILLYTRVYAAASTAAQPACIAIQIGKGLKGCQLGVYKSAGKVTSGNLDCIISGGSQYGIFSKDYNESTGILILDAATCEGSAITSRPIFFSDVSSASSGYITINASKSPALTGVPAILPRIATISDVKAAATDGGSAAAATWNTRTLNTLADTTGIVTSLASNQFVLQPGTYEIEASAPAVLVNSHQIRLRNITSGTTAIVGSTEFSSSADITQTRSELSGTVVISTASTFELQHYTQTARATDGLGRANAVNTGEQVLYSIISIQKVK